MKQILTTLLTLLAVSCSSVTKLQNRIPEFLQQGDTRLKYKITAVKWGKDSDLFNFSQNFTLQISLDNFSEAYEPAGYKVIELGERRINVEELTKIKKDSEYTKDKEYWNQISENLGEAKVCLIEVKLVFAPITNFGDSRKKFEVNVSEQYAGPMGWSLCRVTFQNENKFYYNYRVK